MKKILKLIDEILSTHLKIINQQLLANKNKAYWYEMGFEDGKLSKGYKNENS